MPAQASLDAARAGDRAPQQSIANSLDGEAGLAAQDASPVKPAVIEALANLRGATKEAATIRQQAETDLRYELRGLQDQITQLENDNALMRDASEQIQQEKQKLKDEYHHLTSSVRKLESQARDTRKLDDEIQRLTSINIELRTDIDRRKAEKGSLDSAKAALQSAFDELKIKADDQAIRLLTACAQLEIRTKELQEAKKAREALQSSKLSESEEERLETRCREAEKHRKDALRATKYVLDALHLAGAIAHNKQSIISGKPLDEQLAHIVTAVDSLGKNLQAGREAVSTKETERATLAAQVEHLQSSLTTRNDEIDHLQEANSRDLDAALIHIGMLRQRSALPAGEIDQRIGSSNTKTMEIASSPEAARCAVRHERTQSIATGHSKKAMTPRSPSVESSNSSTSEPPPDRPAGDTDPSSRPGQESDKPDIGNDSSRMKNRGMNDTSPPSKNAEKPNGSTKMPLPLTAKALPDFQKKNGARPMSSGAASERTSTARRRSASGWMDEISPAAKRRETSRGNYGGGNPRHIRRP